MRMVAAVVLLQRQLRSSTDTVGERRAGGTYVSKENFALERPSSPHAFTALRSTEVGRVMV